MKALGERTTDNFILGLHIALAQMAFDRKMRRSCRF
jgi:hypothetical protein